MIHVLIVEDDPMARQLLEIYVEKSGAYALVQSVESAAFAELCCRARQIDLSGPAAKLSKCRTLHRLGQRICAVFFHIDFQQLSGHGIVFDDQNLNHGKSLHSFGTVMVSANSGVQEMTMLPP